MRLRRHSATTTGSLRPWRRRGDDTGPERAPAPTTQRRPLVHIQAEFTTFVESVVLDYLATHSQPGPIPPDALAALDLWLVEEEGGDLPEPPVSSTETTLLDSGLEFVAHVSRYGARSDPAIDPGLVAAIQRLSDDAAEAAVRYGQAPQPNVAAPTADPARVACRLLVSAAGRFGQALQGYLPAEAFRLSEEVDVWVADLKREREEHERRSATGGG